MDLLDIEKGRLLAITILKKESLMAAHSNLSLIEKSFDMGGYDGIERNITAHFKLPEGDYNVIHIRIAIVYIASLLSVERTTHIFTITNISPRTKRGNYIHEAKNKYNISFNVALKERGIQFQENGELKQHVIDAKDFTFHPCPKRNMNWLFLDTQDGSGFDCEYCGTKIVHLAKGKPYEQLLRLYLGGNNLRTKITYAEFDSFFKNNLAQLTSIHLKN